MSRHPSVKWAQRSDRVYITIDLPDAQDVKLKLEPEGKLFFSATSGADKIPYEVDVDLYDKVDVNGSRASVGLRNISYIVKKEENKWWSRLLKQEGKPPVFLKADWDKWVDEDEEENDDTVGVDMEHGDFDFSKMNMGGFDAEAAGDYENDDSDTEEENEVERTAAENKETPPPSTANEPDDKTA